MRALMFAAALALAPAAPIAAHAQTLDAKGRCHGPDGKLAKAAVCARVKVKAPARTAMPMITRCRDVISHKFTRCGGPNAEPVPAN